MLQITLEAKKAQCNDLLERDLIQDYLEDLLCLTNRQQPHETTQEIEPEHAQNLEQKVDKQISQTQTKGSNSENDELCEAQGIEEIPWRQDYTKQVPLHLEVPKTYKEATKVLGLFKPTTSNTAEPTERHKKGIKVPISGTSNVLTQPESQPKPLPGLEYLEDQEDKDPMAESECMIVENHGIKWGQEAQGTLESVQTAQRGVKHDLSDPHAQEDKHLDQVEGQGLEHMVMADHGPKKGMAPQLKPQFNPFFFPFAMCLPAFSTPQDYNLKEGHNRTIKAHSQTSPMGRESNDELELHNKKSSTINTASPNLIQSELTSPWPDQWRLEEQNDDIPNLEDPWPDLEGMNAWNDASDTEEFNLTDDTPYATPWGLVGEPRWMTEPNNAIGPEPEEDPFPLTLHHPNKDNKTKLEGELSPQTSNDVSERKETVSLQNDQGDKKILGQRNPENKSQGSTSDDKKRTTDASHHSTYQKLMHPISDDEEGTMIVEPTSLDTRTLPQNKEVPAIDNATRGRNPHHNQESISHQDMTRRWMTRPQNATHQPKQERSMMPLLQTSTHYPKTSKQNDQSLSDGNFGTLSTSLIQEPADSAKTLPSAMTQDTDANRSSTPPSNDRRPKKHIAPPSHDQELTAITVLELIITTVLTMTLVLREHGLGNTDCYSSFDLSSIYAVKYHLTMRIRLY